MVVSIKLFYVLSFDKIPFDNCQDAEECWTQILYTLSQALRSPSTRYLDVPLAVDNLNTGHACLFSSRDTRQDLTVYKYNIDIL